MAELTQTECFEVTSPEHGKLPATALWPARAEGPLPVCLFLYGGGGDAKTLLALEPLLGRAWADGSLAPLLIGCLGVPPFCFYLEDPEHGARWQSAVSHHLLQTLRSRFPERASAAPAGLVGVSMGGYGALKIAFDDPARHSAVAAIAPMIEPHERAERVPLRNRYHYPPPVPQRLLGPQRDLQLFKADHPATRARRNAAALRETQLPIYIDAGTTDALNAHDGAEYLHRVLWELDIPHEYHLLRQANHVGPTLPARLLAGFQWVARHAVAVSGGAGVKSGGVGAELGGARSELSDEERALDAYLEPLRQAARQADPTLARVYGVLQR